MSVLVLVLSVAASISSIVANLWLRRVENRLIQVENKLTQVVTQVANSTVQMAGGDINVTNVTQTYTSNTPPRFKFPQPPITPPNDTSP